MFPITEQNSGQGVSWYPSKLQWLPRAFPFQCHMNSDLYVSDVLQSVTVIFLLLRLSYLWSAGALQAVGSCAPPTYAVALISFLAWDSRISSPILSISCPTLDIHRSSKDFRFPLLEKSVRDHRQGSMALSVPGLSLLLDFFGG